VLEKITNPKLNLMKLKTATLLFSMLFSFSAFSQLSNAENKALDELIANQVEIETDAIKATAVKNVFDAAFFRLKTIPHYNNNGGFHETVLIKHNGKILEVMEADSLVPFIRSDFKLTKQADAAQLKDALKLLLDSASGREDEIVQKDQQWILVCEEWFGDKKGFVVTTEDGGKVIKIEYSSKLEI
jgi:hypothetical protein